jgi:hypothetical protein
VDAFTKHKVITIHANFFRLADSIKVGMMHCTESVALYNKLICLVSDEEFELEEVFKFYTKESEKLILKNWGKTAKLLIQNPQLKYCRHCFNSNVIIVD